MCGVMPRFQRGSTVSWPVDEFAGLWVDESVAEFEGERRRPVAGITPVLRC